jgi:hypothetical protein
MGDSRCRRGISVRTGEFVSSTLRSSLRTPTHLTEMKVLTTLFFYLS